MATVISREEFLRACNARKEQIRQEREAQLDREFRNAVDTLPDGCRTDFSFNGEQYSIDFENRQFTKSPIKSTTKTTVKEGTLKSFIGNGSVSLNRELGI